jgi:hypothetical protein
MSNEVAPFRLLIWLGAALLGWAVVIGVCLYFPQALVGFAIAGVLLWRKGQRPAVDLVAPVEPVLAGDRKDVRELVSV